MGDAFGTATQSEMLEKSVLMVTRVLAVLVSNANTAGFVVGLLVLVVSVSAWSRPLAGTMLGAVLMLVAMWPLLRPRSER